MAPSSSPEHPRLLVVAHGTASPEGALTTARLVDAVRAARSCVPVGLAFLDVLDPRLPSVLDDAPAVVVPVLLSTGYHVQDDIPAAVAAHPRTWVARHLGPHPLLVDALVDRLAELGPGVGPVALVGAGSTRADARDELDATAELLAARLGEPVAALTIGADLRAELRAAGAVRVATYLLAEGQFVETVCEAGRGLAPVSAPIGVHPALVRLVWERYDDVVAGRWDGRVR